MIPLREQNSLKARFARDLTGRVKVDFFSRKPSQIYSPGRQECVNCDDVRQLIREVSGLSALVSLTQHDIDGEPEAAKKMDVSRVPALVLHGVGERTVRFFGCPMGRQFTTLVEMLVLLGHGQANLQPDTVKTLRRVRAPVDLKIFVTPECAHSPIMALTAVRLALGSSHIHLSIFDVGEFPDLVRRYMVRATPLVALQDQYAVLGVMEEAALAANVLLASQGEEPKTGGDAKRLTPLNPPQPRQQQRQAPRTSPGGLIIPR